MNWMIVSRIRRRNATGHDGSWSTAVQISGAARGDTIYLSR